MIESSAKVADESFRTFFHPASITLQIVNMAMPPPFTPAAKAMSSSITTPSPSSPPLSRLVSRSSTTIAETEEPSRHDFRHQASNWGEEIDVAKPLDPNDPSFLELQRALTGGSRQGDDTDWNLEKKLQGHKRDLQDQGVSDKRLDVAWKHLSVRGVGADVMVSFVFVGGTADP